MTLRSFRQALLVVAALIATAATFACARSAEPSRIVDVSPSLGVLKLADRPDAGESVGCPEGSRWNGKVCLGAGFVACRPGEHLDNDACTRPSGANTAELAPLPPPTATPRRIDDDESSITGAIECDRYGDLYAKCMSKSLPRGKQWLTEWRAAYRIQLLNPKMRDQVRRGCEIGLKQLAAICKP